MSNINIITYPDLLYNHSFALFLAFCPIEIKTEINNLIEEIDVDLDVYVCDEVEYQQIDWFLQVHRNADICVINLDMISPVLKNLESFFISFSNTFWFSQGENPVYRKISNNRFYAIDHIKTIIGNNVKQR